MKKKSKTIKVDEAIDKFYKRNKAKLDNIWGNERSAKSHLKYDTENMPADHFNDNKTATKRFNNTIARYADPAAYDLSKAKQEANENTPKYSSLNKLNKKIDKNKLNYTNRSISQTEEIFEYYDIKNDSNILAHVRERVSQRSIVERWVFLDRSYL